MVVLSVGVKPAIELAVQMGVEAGPYGGIQIDSHMKTTLPDIYAAGDVAETHDIARGAPSSMPSGPVPLSREPSQV